MRLIITKQSKLFTVCTELVRSPYIEHAASGLPNPTRLEGGGVRFIQAQDQQVLPHIVRVVTECLPTRSMLIKIYLPLHGMCLYMYIVFTVSQFQMLTQSI